MTPAYPPAAPETAAPKPGKFPLALVLTLVLGTMLLPLNSTMVAAVLHPIVQQFKTSTSTATWTLVTLYLVAVAVAAPFGGAVADRLGRRNVFIGGLAVFAAASLVSAATPGFALPLLVLGRLGQALGAAMLAPTAMAIIRLRLPADQRGGAFGILGAAMGLASAFGVPIGGLLTALPLGWRAIFGLDVVLALAVIGLSFLWVQDPPRAAQTALITGGGLAGLGRLLANRAWLAAVVGILLQNAVMYALLLLAPLYLESWRGLSAAGAGELLAPFALLLVLLAPVGGVIADRRGRRAPALVGDVALVVGLVWLGLLVTGTTSVVVFMIGLCLAGLGLGLASTSLRTVSAEESLADDAGLASGVASALSYVGYIGGSALVGVLATGAGSGITVGGLHTVFVILIALAVLLLGVCALLPTTRPVRRAGGRKGRTPNTVASQ